MKLVGLPTSRLQLRLSVCCRSVVSPSVSRSVCIAYYTSVCLWCGGLRRARINARIAKRCATSSAPATSTRAYLTRIQRHGSVTPTRTPIVTHAPTVRCAVAHVEFNFASEQTNTDIHTHKKQQHNTHSLAHNSSRYIIVCKHARWADCLCMSWVHCE